MAKPLRGRLRTRARSRQEKGERTDLFKLMKERGRTRLTSAVWAKALERGDSVEFILAADGASLTAFARERKAALLY